LLNPRGISKNFLGLFAAKAWRFLFLDKRRGARYTIFGILDQQEVKKGELKNEKDM